MERAPRAVRASSITKAFDAILEARQVCPGYGAGLSFTPEGPFQDLLHAVGMEVVHDRLGGELAVLVPFRGAGQYHVAIEGDLPIRLRDQYLVRHKLGHVLAGDAQGVSIFRFGDPFTTADRAADLFAFADLIGEEDFWMPAMAEIKLKALMSAAPTSWTDQIPRMLRKLKRLRCRLRGFSTPRPKLRACGHP